MLARWLLARGRTFVILQQLACAAASASSESPRHLESLLSASAPTQHARLHRRPQAMSLAVEDDAKDRWTSGALPHTPINESLGIDDEMPPTIDVHSIEGNSLHDVREIAKVIVVPATGVFLISIVTAGFMEKLPVLGMVPESAWTVLVAVFLGLGIRNLMSSGYISMHGYTVMNTSVLNLGLLPLIIFTSGWMLRRRNFVSQFHYILVYAVLGTVASTAMIGLCIAYTVNSLGYELTLRESFVFASLISAVDPVATLATYSKLQIDESQPLLHTLVFGESVINDAVAIVLFGLFNETPIDDIDFYSCSMEITRLLFGSIFFGLLIAGLLIFTLRIANLEGESRAEIAYIYISAYFVFGLSESLHFSGIISTLFAGILFRRYGANHLTPKGRHRAAEILEHGAYKADTAVFLLCGASTALINSSRAFLFGCYATLLCLVVRAFTVLGCSQIANGIKKFYGDQHMITWKHQIMLWHSGLRGGIALVLALEINGEWCAHKATIIDGTFVVIVALLLTCGSTTELLIEALGFGTGGEDASRQDDPTFNPTMTSAPHALRLSGKHEEDHAEDTWWSRFLDYSHKALWFLLVSFNVDGPMVDVDGENQDSPKVNSEEYDSFVQQLSSKSLTFDSESLGRPSA